jgi:hypothetical protein
MYTFYVSCSGIDKKDVIKLDGEQSRKAFSVFIAIIIAPPEAG